MTTETPGPDDHPEPAPDGGGDGELVVSRLPDAPPPAVERARLRRLRYAITGAILGAVLLLAARLPFLHPPAGTPSSVVPTTEPTAASVAAHPAIVLPAAPWERVPLPQLPGVREIWAAPAPTNPDMLYLCANAGYAPDTAPDRAPVPVRGPIELWLTRDAGAHWSRADLPVLIGAGCQVQVAPDAPDHAVLLVSDYAGEHQVCANTALYQTLDGGATWAPFPQAPPVAPDESNGGPLVLITAHVLSVWCSYHAPLSSVAPSGGPGAYLLHSTDGVHWSWLEGPYGGASLLYAPVVAGDGNGIVLPVDRLDDAGHPAPGAIWQTPYAGEGWQKVAPLPAEGIPQLYASPLPWLGTSGGGLSPLYVPTRYGSPHELYLLGVLQTTDNAHWGHLPPLPVPGASAGRIGLTDLLGVAPDGRLLALGADPAVGVPVLNGPNLPLESAQTLWAWNPLAARWERLPTQLPVSWPDDYGCSDHCWRAGFALAPDGATYIYVAPYAFDGATSQLYRLRLPSAARPARP